MSEIVIKDRFAAFRWSLYGLMIAAASGGAAGRILAVNAVDQVRLESYLRGQGRENLTLQRPFLSANDRSRWATARSLVEYGTFAFDDIVSQPGWDTIDMVQHLDSKGVPRLYSSKPPLLATILAGQYWLVHRLTGATLGTHPYEIGRGLLVLNNVVALAILLLVVAAVTERLGTTDWGRCAVMAAATFGTFLSTFVVVINNHLPAALSSAIVLVALVRIYWTDDRSWLTFAVAGFFAAFAVANELPALSLFAMVTALLLLTSPGPTCKAYLPAAAAVVVAYFGTNYVAHQSWRPPYAHRGDGAELFQLDVTTERLAELDDGLRDEFTKAGHKLSDAAFIEIRTPESRWVVEDPESHTKYAIVRDGDAFKVRAWDNWYDYSFERDGRVRESYWRHRSKRSKIDQGEDSLSQYAFHVLVGHHGIFSLTPLWLLAPVGLMMWLGSGDRRLILLSLGIGALSVVCIAFYLTRSVEDRNYGGMTSGFRWAFWLIPLWLAAILPACDWLSKFRAGRLLFLLFLAASVMSVSYPTWNPWTHPWLTEFLRYLGWIDL